MSLKPKIVGKAVASIVKDYAPKKGKKISEEELKSMWEKIISEIFTGSGGITHGYIDVDIASVGGPPRKGLVERAAAKRYGKGKMS